MILPAERERIRDLRTREAEAHIDLCQVRAITLAKAAYASYSNSGSPEPVLSYMFTDGFGGSGLQRGDIIRCRVFGTYSSDTSGVDTDVVMSVVVNSVTSASIMITRGDLSGDLIAFDCEFWLRLQGGEGKTINSPSKSSSTLGFTLLRATFGDTSTSTWSRSQSVQDSWITSTDVVGTAINLAIPVNVQLKYEGTTGGNLTIYGGALEGL